MQARDQDILKKRQEIEQESEEVETEKEELPPPLTLEEIEQIKTEESRETVEYTTVSGDGRLTEMGTENVEAPIKEIAGESQENTEVTDEETATELSLTENKDTEASDTEALVDVPAETEELSILAPLKTETDNTVESIPTSEKTFEEIEVEADGEFQSEMNTETESIENEDLSPVNELQEPKKEAEMPEPIQESVETIGKSVQDIMKHSSASNHHTEKLFELTNQAKTFMARGMTADARTAIIEGLSLKKDHRDLNLILAEIYEQEQDYEKAEIIYKDIALVYHEDSEVLRRLANLLIITKKFPIAYEMYKKILSLGGDDENSLYILAHLAQELGDMSDVYQYSRQYLKQWPTNKEILTLLSESEIALGKRKDAIATLIKLKNLSPYNAFEIAQMIEKLSAEEELAGNF